MDYFKPTDDESKAEALVTAIKNVVGYQKILDRYSGKRLPQVDILSNLVEREFNLAADAAKICASVFVASAQRAGLVQGDNTLVTALSQHSRPAVSPEATNTKVAPHTSPTLQIPSAEDSESHFLTLDAKRGRRVILQAPSVITSVELKRIQNWLAVQFHVVDSVGAGDSELQLPDLNDSDKNISPP